MQGSGVNRVSTFQLPIQNLKRDFSVFRKQFDFAIMEMS